jgi:hypothetical protein
MGMDISVDKVAKIFKVTVDGFPTPENAQTVLKNYQDIVSGVNAKENSLLIDCTGLGVFQQESIAILEKLFKLYMDVGFKNIVFIKSKKSIQNMQLTRVAKSIPGFYGVFVDDMDEALKICKKS